MLALQGMRVAVMAETPSTGEYRITMMTNTVAEAVTGTGIDSSPEESIAQAYKNALEQGNTEPGILVTRSWGTQWEWRGEMDTTASATVPSTSYDEETQLYTTVVTLYPGTFTFYPWRKLG